MNNGLDGTGDNCGEDDLGVYVSTPLKNSKVLEFCDIFEPCELAEYKVSGHFEKMNRYNRIYRRLLRILRREGVAGIFKRIRKRW